MLEKKRVSFRPMNEDDLVLMLKWLTDDRVLEFYDGRDKKHTQKTIREQYTEQWADEIYRVIIEYDTIPIGYAQIYRIQGELFDEYNYQDVYKRQFQKSTLIIAHILQGTFYFHDSQSKIHLLFRIFFFLGHHSFHHRFHA